MKGDQHVLLSILSAAIVIAPLVDTLTLLSTAVLFFGVLIGSLAPDADAADAAIFHGKKKTSLLLPLFGYTIRYLIYYPMTLGSRLLFGGRGRPRHRGILHSLAGVTVTSVLISLYIFAIFTILEVQSQSLVLLFGLGFFSGCILHLLEDSCTAMGVAWGLPFRTRRIRGTLNTRSIIDPRPAAFSLALVVTTAFLFIAPSTFNISGIPLTCLSLLSFSILWALFLLASGVRADP
ncbi:MAG TPA: metal-dependent hydrolase [Methanomicrobiales archaeon]|nr:metal-dependent hydrolase [Methanomicrobiales archaeon]